mmetsp:Transcript_15591/g.50761  ORF Transcript_15591/g.50761 Transcript_15591/m.50761 type:complete len:216 (+) Transcript_15591:1705-2352(+)
MASWAPSALKADTARSTFRSSAHRRWARDFVGTARFPALCKAQATTSLALALASSLSLWSRWWRPSATGSQRWSRPDGGGGSESSTPSTGELARRGVRALSVRSSAELSCFDVAASRDDRSLRGRRSEGRWLAKATPPLSRRGAPKPNAFFAAAGDRRSATGDTSSPRRLADNDRPRAVPGATSSKDGRRLRRSRDSFDSSTVAPSVRADVWPPG